MKNTKIMVVLAVFLAAALFIGAASAADATVSAKTDKLTYDHDGTITLTITSNTTISNYSINVTYAGVTIHPGAFDTKNVSTTTLTASYGNETIVLSQNTTGADQILSLPMTLEITVNNRPVEKGHDAFVFEHIFVDGANGKLIKYSEGQNPTAVNTISGDGNVFYLTESVVNGQYGAYYYGGDQPGTTSQGNYIYIWYPEISLQAELTDSPGDSIDGQGITKETEVTFLINSPQVQPAFGTGAAAKIIFTTPSNGKTTYFGKKNINNEPLTGTQTAIKAGVIGTSAEAGTWTAQAEYTLEPFATYAAKSNTISFTVRSESLTVTADKDSVIRSNPFVVAISGEAKTDYSIYITNPEDDANKNPSLMLGQPGYQGLDSDGHAVFETKADGTRTVQFNTYATTEDKSFTVRVERTADVSDWDEVKVKVEKGAVTISASGDGSYYIGEEITLTGSNTDSDDIFLFITGPNLDANGVVLKTVGTTADPASTYRTADVSVKTDNTWEYKWDTAECGLDTGSYTIWATSALTNGKSSSSSESAKKLSDSEYATVSVSLKQPFLSAVPSGTIVAKGDTLYITGTAEGDPSSLMLYIFGPNYYHKESISVEDDGSYEKKFDVPSTMASNQYYVVIEHPMYNDAIDVHEGTNDAGAKILYINNANVSEGMQSSFVVEGQGRLQSSNAANALTTMIDSANIDDVYTKLTFTVTEPRIDITNPGDQGVGTTFTISGTTNLAVGDQITVDVQSSSFEATDKTSTSVTDGVAVTTKVVAGDGTENVWSVEVDTTNWKLDEYTIKASGIEVDVTATTNFNLVEKVVVTPTATATGATPTTTATATATTAPTQTPGFGAFIALAGLGAVALLVLRRN
ncbi:MAG: PGF-CTERM sorting domain-containing protein [Candidatus Methanocorpusculum faecipullorum]|nr:PGF-CTERM sorting domain-containing protein [Candidatus Methanocorpusculum faecipullorum]